MNTAKLRIVACVALATAGLSACMDNRYYVKTDGSTDVMGGVAHLAPPAKPPEPISVGVTFKSAGKVLPAGADVLFQSVSNDLRAKGQWDVQRLGRPTDDFTPVITAVIQSRAGAAASRSITDTMQRLLVLVENVPDLSGGTQVNYFISGMTFGLHSLHKPTDRYDVTIAFRDARGMDHVYRSHQDLLFSTGSKLFGSDDEGLKGLKQFDNPSAAFDTIVANSVNGAQKHSIAVGKPQLGKPDAQTVQPAASVKPPVKP
jgi:hypothetical protein